MVTLGLAAVFLFKQLGHYALWDDEAFTAVNGQGVWRTGDTSAISGHNIVASRGGLELRGFNDHCNPPLEAYVVAPFTAMTADPDARMVRLPFALCGLGAIGLVLWWLRRENASWRMWLLTAMAILGNVSLFLYCRQCRYYALSILLSASIAYVYLHWNGRRGGLILLAVLSTALLAANSLNYAAMCAVLAVDYLLWQRKRRTLRGWDWVWLLLPQIVCGAIILSIWNPLTIHAITKGPAQGVADRLKLVWWYVRDMNTCEFGSIGLWVALPVAYWLSRDPWLLRGGLAMAVYVLVTALASPENVHLALLADVRYVAPVILLCIALGAWVLSGLRGRWAWAGLLLGALAFGTNLLNGGPWLALGPRCTVWQYARELAAPPPDPYRAASDWINLHVDPGQSVSVLPASAAPPMIFHAPGPIYAWQLSFPPAPQFSNLAPIYFYGQGDPDFMVAFGRDALARVRARLRIGPSAPYELVAALPVYGLESYRPELFWHSFVARPCDVRRGEGIYIFRVKQGM